MAAEEPKPEYSFSAEEELKNELLALREDNQALYQELQEVRDSERSTRAQLNKLQHMSRSQAMVLRSYANAKLRDALAVLHDADLQDEDQVRRREILAEFVENGAFAGVEIDGQENMSNNNQEKLEELQKQNEELREKLAKKGRKNSVPRPDGPPPDGVERQSSAGADSSMQVAMEDLEHQNSELRAKVQELEGSLQAQLDKASAGGSSSEVTGAAAETTSAATAENEKKDKEIRKLKKKIKEIRESQEKEKEELMDCMAQELEEVEQKAGKDREKLKRKIQKLNTKLSGNKDLLRSMKTSMMNQLSSLKRQKDEILGYARQITSLAGNTSSQIAFAINSKMENIEALKSRYEHEARERKRLHNLVQELRGNIRVYCRVRPPNEMELAQGNGAEICASFPGEGDVQLVNERGKNKKWDFDKVFDFNSTQPQIYSEVRGLVTSVLDGYNVCIFAYGQTGAGKTFTMMGPADPELRGVNTRALSDLFTLSDERKSEISDQIEVSVLEIYNESIRDLLAQDVGGEKLDVRQGPHGNYVPGLTLVGVENLDEVLQILGMAESNRSTVSTNMNEHSSRSHLMLSVYLKSRNVLTGEETRGKLHLVDLAGSERINKSGATGQALKEAQNINKSLSALGDVIASRAQKSNHVPFRNSVLTHLLQDSLSSDAKTLMLVCISPAMYNAEESFSSLNFASRVKTVELGKATRNVQRRSQR